MRAGRVSIAKITRPKASGVLRRERLFSVLDSDRTRPLVWVAGPPGAGKTTLVASWLEARRLPCLWYQVDEGDGDIATFFYYMGLAARKEAPRNRKPLPLLTPEYLQNIPTFTRRYFENLYGRLQPPFALVFDNYQTVSAESQFHEALSLGLSQMPEGSFAVVISRTEPPPAFARLRAHEQMVLIDDHALRLTDEESHALAELRGLGKEAPDTIRILHQRTEGWTAGLVLILELLKKKSLPAEALAHQPPQAVFDYFAGEIFQKADDQTKTLLLKTAFIPTITTGMAERLTGLDKAGRILGGLVQKNYFTVKHSSLEPVYQYHPLFREFLVTRAREVFSAEDISRIQRNAAALLVETGHFEDAASLLSSAKDWDGCARLVLGQAKSLIAQGRSVTLEEWILAMPEELRAKRPWLLFWLAMCKQAFNPAGSRALFEKAFHAFKASRDPAGWLLSWAGAVDTFIYEWHEFARLDRWIQELDIHLRGQPSFPSLEIEARVSASMMGALLLRRPDHPHVRKWTERALALARKSEDAGLRLQAYMNAGAYYDFMGDHANAGAAAEELGKAARSSSATPLTITSWKWMEAYVNTATTTDYDLSLQLLSEGQETAQKNGVHVWDHQSFGVGVVTCLNKGDFKAAAEYLKKKEETLASGQRMSVSQYHHLAAWYYLLLGDVPRAREHAEAGLALAIDSGAPFAVAILRLSVAQTLHAAGDFREARDQLNRAAKDIKRCGSLILEYMCGMAKAQFAFDQGNREAAALASLRKAMTLGREQNYITMFFWWQPDVMARLCAKALEAGIEVEYVKHLIRARNLVPDAPPLKVESWPWPVKIHTLGRFSLLLDDRPVRFPGKAQHKPLEMLKALIAFGGRDVGVERLAETLWPDALGDAAQQAFDTTLHRLRKLLGQEKAVQLREGQVSLDPRCCWVDIWALERLMSQAESSRSPELTEKALALYQGPFLGQETEQPWAIPLRERLRSRIIRLMGKQCRQWEEAKKWRKAAECYQRALEVDDLAEEFYQRLMLSYQRMGRRTEALAVYQRCRKILSSVFGIEPSPETEAIYKSLLQNQ